MEKQIKIVGLAGSLAVPSRSLAAINIALARSANSGAVTQVFDIRTLNLAFYVPGNAVSPTAKPSIGTTPSDTTT
jgi:NAD(P)H-dependent FMN reductase